MHLAATSSYTYHVCLSVDRELSYVQFCSRSAVVCIFSPYFTALGIVYSGGKVKKRKFRRFRRKSRNFSFLTIPGGIRESPNILRMRHSGYILTEMSVAPPYSVTFNQYTLPPSLTTAVARLEVEGINAQSAIYQLCPNWTRFTEVSSLILILFIFMSCGSTSSIFGSNVNNHDQQSGITMLGISLGSYVYRSWVKGK